MRLRALVLAVVAALAVGAAPVGADGFVDEQYMASKPPVANVPGWISGYYDDSIDDVRTGSVLFGGKQATAGWSELEICESMTDPKCAGFSTFSFTSFLPVCSESVATDCVAGVTATSPAGESLGTFTRPFPERGETDFVGNPAIGLPNGATPTLWRLEGAKHAGGDTYMVSAAVSGWVNGGNVESQLRINIFPVSIKPAPDDRKVHWHVAEYPNGLFGPGAWDEREYLYRGGSEVAVRWPFPAETQFKLTVRVAKPLTGWLHGRVQDPSISIETGGYGQQFTVAAYPTVVPAIDHWTQFSSLPQPLQDILKAEGRPSGAFYFGKFDDTDWNAVTTSHQSGGRMDDVALKKFLYFVDVAKDKAAASKSAWTIRTMNAHELGSASQCLKGATSLAGVVSTNATVYLAGPPTFNAETGSLDYKVAAPHYDRNGGTNIGAYTLVMRSDVARCAYGFSSAPVSGSVQVVSADGTQQVATTNVKEANGWLYLTAVGYTYSSPTVRVTLQQEKPVVVPKPVVKKTITCVKGKTVKKVTAVAPKCPAGFKKKA